MSYSVRAVQALTLCGALLLAACSSPTKDEMYRGGNTAQDKQSTATTTEEKPAALSAKRMAALKEFGLNDQSQPTKLVGLDGFEIRQVLGDPSFVRRDNGVEIWQYRAQNCILDLFLYQNGGHFSVNHSELRGPLLDSRSQSDCFQTILMGRTS